MIYRIQWFRALSAILLLCCSTALVGQSERGRISGRVTDPSGAALQGAQITVIPGNRTIKSDAVGDFTLTDVPAGEYTIQASYIGFAEKSTQVTVSAAKTTTTDLVMQVSSKNEDIIVVADRVHGEAEAINRIRTGDNILQIATSEMITSLPNANMADAIGRMPSVTLERDEGEGAYIQVRGTEPRLTNVTVNGNTIPSEEGGIRQIRLDAVASDLVDSVEVNKTLSANQDADGIGGSVNFVTKVAEEKPTMIITGLGGFSPIAGGRKVSQFNATMGRRFGARKSLGILGGFTWDFNGRGFDDIEPSYADDSTTYGDLQTREYMYDRSRYGFAGSIDKKLAGGSSIYLKGLFSEFYDYGDKWYYDYIQASAPKFYTSKKSPTYAISSISLGGKHFFGLSSLHWELSPSYSWEDAAAGNPKADFSWVPASGIATKINYTIDQTTHPHLPQFTPINATLDQIHDPSNWVLADAYTSSGRSGALSLAGALDYTRVHTIGSHYGEFSMGFKVRNVHRGQNALQYIYDIGGTGKKASSSLPSTYRMTNFLSDFTNSNYYDGAYKLGPVSDFTKIIKDAVLSSSPLLLLDEAKTFSKSATANYNLVERITAGYMMESVDLASRVHLQFGLRFENTYENGTGFVYDPSTVQATKSAPGIQTYLDALPSVQLRFSPNPNVNVRMVYSRGIARPDPLDLVPYINETDGVAGACPSSDNCAGTLSMGNPNLVAEYANNYDLLYEQFLPHLGLLQAGFFHKDLTKPLFQTQNVVQYLGDNFAATEWVNGSDAHLTGFEVSFQQRLSYLPGLLGGFGINANYSYTTSEANGIPYGNGGTTTYRSAALLRQAPNTWNIGPTYDRGRISYRAGISYNQANIYQYANVDPGCTDVTCNATGPAGDEYQNDHTQIDMQGTFRLWRGLHFLAYAQNLTNEPFGYFNGSKKYMIQREFYKPTFTFGFKYYPFNREK